MSLTVSNLLYPAVVVEFFLEPDFYQLRVVHGQRQPEHRWRHKRAAGISWSSWRPISMAWWKRWRDLPALLLPVAEAESNPLERWPSVSREDAAPKQEAPAVDGIRCARCGQPVPEDDDCQNCYPRTR